MEIERKETRLILLETLHSMIIDLSSPIYNGFISCKIDSTYSNNIIPESKENKEIKIFSADPNVSNIFYYILFTNEKLFLHFIFFIF
jgi:hypothetical protein